MIKGLRYIPDFISEEEQSALLISIDALLWNNDLKRRTQHYGYKYDYTKKSINKEAYVGPIPDFIQPLIARFSEHQIDLSKADQVIVNEYQPGQGIAKHVDCVPCFGPVIASLSLGSSCVMEFDACFEFAEGSMMLGPKSLIVLADEARYNWTHAIPALKEDLWKGEKVPRERRVSLTFRTVKLDA